MGSERVVLQALQLRDRSDANFAQEADPPFTLRNSLDSRRTLGAHFVVDAVNRQIGRSSDGRLGETAIMAAPLELLRIGAVKHGFIPIWQRVEDNVGGLHTADVSQVAPGNQIGGTLDRVI